MRRPTSVALWTSFGVLTGVLGILGTGLALDPAILRKTWLLGWLLFVLVVSAIPIIVAMSRPLERAGNVEADRKLLRERLRDWTQDSPFMEWLVESANHRRFPRTRMDEIESAAYRWARDDRQFNNQQLQLAFEQTRVCITSYHAALCDDMWVWDNGPNGDRDDRYLSVPIEWETLDPERWFKAHERLGEGRTGLIKALRNLFKVAHDAVQL